MPFAFASLCALALVASAQPAIEGTERSSEISVATNGHIAFVDHREGNADIFLVDPNGRNPRRLTSGGGKDTPSWSPDGRLIAFVWERDNDADIYIVDLTDGVIRPAITGPAYEIHPGWSQDGSRLMFTRYTEGEDEFEALTLHTANRDGSDEASLGTASYGSYSPDGTQVAYWRYFDENADIAIANANGSNERRITTDPAFDGWPSWSPDGRLIAFARRTDEGAMIHLFDVETGESCPVSQGQGSDTSPRWRPDGTGLFFDRSGDGQLSIMSLRFGEMSFRRVQSSDTGN